MNYSDLVSEYRRATNATEDQAKDEISNMLKIIGKALTRGDSVVLKDFGTFHVKELEERIGSHPKTGETVLFKAKTKVSFKQSKNLLA